MIKLQNLKQIMLNTIKTLRSRLVSFTLLVMGVGLTFGVIASPIASADQYSAQIQSLQTQNSAISSTIAGLQGQATTYQQQVDQLTAEINAIEQQQAITEGQISSIQSDIQANQIKLTQEKSTLDTIIKSMYVDGNLNTLEMLATSNNISDFVTKEEYKNIVQSQIQDTLTSINATQVQLKAQNQDLSSQLSHQTAINNQLSANEAQQAQLLSYNQAQQDQYNQQIHTNQSQISVLEAEQAAINERSASSIVPPSGGGVGGNCGTPSPWYTGSSASAPNGGYPMNWCNAAQDSVITLGNFPNRECTSFAYWYFTTQESGHSGFSVTGNANQWENTANRPVDQNPADGSIAVDPAGTYGHVMIVVATPGQNYGGNVVPAGYIDTISMNDDWHGDFFSLQRPYAGFYFIH